MLELKRINSLHEHYPFMEELMQTAFPSQERRDTELQRTYTDNQSRFHNNVLLDNGTPIGLLTYWDFDTFLYIEHFAISSERRNKGYGQQALATLKAKQEGMIVLEVEEPIDEITRRRVIFYQRQGFILQNYPYEQPPYRDGDEWFPMKIMSFQTEDFTEDTFLQVKSTIYQEVYGKAI